MFQFSDLQADRPKDWPKFESLCRDLWRAEWRCPSAKKNGRSGQAQHGVDVYGRPNHGKKWSGIQCKGKDTYSKKMVTIDELKKEVAKAKKFRPELAEFILATTGPKDAKVEEEARKITSRHLVKGLFTVDVVAWEEIQELLCEHSEVLVKYYPQYRSVDERIVELLSGTLDTINDVVMPIRELTKSSQKLAKSVSEGILDEKKVQSLANAIAAKVTESGKPDNPKKTSARSAIGVIPANRLFTLGVIADSVLERSVARFKELLPDINWDRDVPFLKRRGVIRTKGGVILVESKTKKTLFSDEEFRQRVKSFWITGLEKLNYHPDALAELAIHYIGSKNPWMSAKLLIEAEQYIKPKHWDEIYCNQLQQVDKHFLKLLPDSPISRNEIRYAICRYKLNLELYDDALSWSARLKSISRKPELKEWYARSFLIASGAKRACGDRAAAMASLDKAISIAKAIEHDKAVLGDALFEKFDIVSEFDSAEALQLLDEVSKTWSVVGDKEKLADCDISRGEIHIRDGSWSLAIKAYTDAIKKSEKPRYAHGYSHAHCRLGMIYLETEQLPKAIDHFRIAQKAALTDQKYIETASNAIHGEAVCRLLQGKIKTGRRLFESMRELCNTYESSEGEAAAIYNIAQSYLQENNPVAARRSLQKAIRICRSSNLDQWLVSCLSSTAVSFYEPENSNERVVSKFVTLAKNEPASIAFRLHLECASFVMNNSTEIARVEEALGEAKSCLDYSKSPVEELQQVFDLSFRWYWNELGDEKQAINQLEELQILAKKKGDLELRCRLSLQIAACYLNVHQPKKAKQILKTARGLAGKTNAVQRTDVIRLEAECHRQLGNIEKAKVLFEDSVSQAMKTQSFDCKTGAIFGMASILWEISLKKETNDLIARHASKSTWSNERECMLYFEFSADFYLEVDALREAASWFRKALTISTLAEDAARIRLGLARALSRSKQYQKAIDILEEHAAEHKDVLADQHFGILAFCYSELGQKRKEHQYWKKAVEHSQSNGNIDEAIETSSILAYQYEERGRFDLADETIGIAIRLASNPRERAAHLLHRLGILMQANKKSAVEQCFNEVRTLANEHQYYDILIDAHGWLGDYYWEQAISRKVAVQAYLMAEIFEFVLFAENLDCETEESTSQYVDRLGEHKGALTAQLRNVRPDIRIREMRRLEKVTKHWLENECGMSLQPWLIHNLLLPFRAGIRYSLHNRDWTKIPDGVIDEIIDDEIRKGEALIDE